jgi:putative phosphoribosyl transferase
MIFRDRVDAGKQLAEEVVRNVTGQGLVLGIPRGGVVTAGIVAEELNWPLDILAAKKIPSPENPELAVGANVKPPSPKLLVKLKNIKQVVLIDDGVATGQTLEAGIKYLQDLALFVIAAVPIAAKDSAERIKKIADKWICLSEPEDLKAVGQYYQEFDQVSDAEVVKLLYEANRRFG